MCFLIPFFLPCIFKISNIQIPQMCERIFIENTFQSSNPSIMSYIVQFDKFQIHLFNNTLVSGILHRPILKRHKQRIPNFGSLAQIWRKGLRICISGLLSLCEFVKEEYFALLVALSAPLLTFRISTSYGIAVILTKGILFFLLFFSPFACSNTRVSSPLRTQKLVYPWVVAVLCPLKCVRRVYRKMQTMLSRMAAPLWRILSGGTAKHCLHDYMYLWARGLKNSGFSPLELATFYL